MKNKTIAFVILFFAFMAEYFHTLFKGLGVHSYYLVDDEKLPIMWKAMIYHLLNEFFVLLLIVILWFKIGTTRAAKALMTGIVFWFFIEFIEISLQICYISDARLYINDGSWMQLSSCLTVSLLALFGMKK